MAGQRPFTRSLVAAARSSLNASATTWLAVVILGILPARAASTYVIDQRNGTLGFEIVEAGVFTSKGLFTRFSGALTLDFQHPGQSRIDMSAEAGSADIPGPGAIDMLRSAAYFDTAHFPLVHFVSAAITPLGGDRFHIDGVIEIRGVARPQSFEAALTQSGDVARFAVTGGLPRSAFGMVADQDFISDTVHLDIRLALALGPAR